GDRAALSRCSVPVGRRSHDRRRAFGARRRLPWYRLEGTERMDFDLTEEQRRTRMRFDALFQEHVAPTAVEVDRTGVVPSESWKHHVDCGYLRLFHPKRYGGLEADAVTLCVAMESLAKACGGTFWTATVSSLLFGK